LPFVENLWLIIDNMGLSDICSLYDGNTDSPSQLRTLALHKYNSMVFPI